MREFKVFKQAKQPLSRQVHSSLINLRSFPTITSSRCPLSKMLFTNAGCAASCFACLASCYTLDCCSPCTAATGIPAENKARCSLFI